MDTNPIQVDSSYQSDFEEEDCEPSVCYAWESDTDNEAEDSNAADDGMKIIEGLWD